jgi:two-component system, OmpR family, alkaline phosphatase synthesis response regulator PhoP
MKKILVIDDNELHLQLIQHILGKEEFEITKFKSSPDAIEWLKSNPVNLVLLDIQLPLMNGVEFLKEMRSQDNLKDIKCIALTAQQRFQNQTFEELGFDGYIGKPINPKSFAQYVKSLL